MKKDYITITKIDGNVEQMEVVATFKLEETSKDYIIYKSLNDNKYYAASYDSGSEYSNLNTILTDKEKEQLNQIFNSLNYGGKTNA